MHAKTQDVVQVIGFDYAVECAPNLSPPIKKFMFLLDLCLPTMQLPVDEK